jgi:hypothetical protein
MYMGTSLTRASARDGTQRMLANYERAKRRNRPSIVHGDGISAPQVAYAQTYSANFYSGSQYFTSLLKTFRETGQVLSHHQTSLRYRNGRRFF